MPTTATNVPLDKAALVIGSAVGNFNTASRSGLVTKGWSFFQLIWFSFWNQILKT